MAGDAADFLARLDLFAGLAPGEISELALAAEPFSLAPGEVLFRQGAPAETMVCVERGRLRLVIRVAGTEESDLGFVGPGSVLGETVLVDRGTRAATAIAVEPTSGWALSGRAFRVLLAAYRPSASKVARRLAAVISDRIVASAQEDGSDPPPATGWPLDLSPYRFDPLELDRENLAGLPFLQPYSPDELEQLLADCHALALPQRTVIFREGERPGSCYLTVRGAVEVYVERHGVRRKLALQGPGSMFGEAALLTSAPRSATCWAREHSILLEVERLTFERLFEDQSLIAYKFLDGVIRLLIDVMRRSAVRRAWFEAERRALTT